MSVKWTAESNTIENYEGMEIDQTFSCVGNPDSGNNVKIEVLSSSLPEDIKTEVKYSGSKITGFRIYGVLPQIINETVYYITARLEECDDRNNVLQYTDKYFKIINKETRLYWTRPLNISCYENTELSYSIKDAEYEEGGETKKYINGLNGDEVFRKVSGQLPSSLSLSSNGVLSGMPLREDVNKSFTFGLALYRGEEIILEPTNVTVNVEEIRKDIPPTWVTETSILDTINAGQEATNVKVIAIINSDESDPAAEKRVTYRLIENLGRLPTGLTLTTVNNQGVIRGTLSTSEIKDWEFTIEASRVHNGVTYSSRRNFYIRTNEASPEHRINWNGDLSVIDAGSYPVGTTINEKLPKAVAADGSTVRYMVVDKGNFPENISIDSSGVISGIAELPRGNFECSVRAYTDVTYVTKTVRITILKGLGENSLDLSLRINLEYKDEFMDIMSQLNSSASYGANQEGYDVDIFPKINIATLSCFDREVLAGIFNYGAPEIVRVLDTRYKTYSDLDVNGDPIETYEAYYKAIDENTYDWADLNIGSFDFQKQMELEIQQTESFEGETDIPYFYPMESDAELDFNKEYHKSDLTQVQWIRKKVGDDVYYELKERDIETNPSVKFKVFNIKNVRDMLQKNIYVKKISDRDCYYDVGSQQLFEKTGIVEKKLFEEVDENYNTKVFISNLDGSNRIEVLYQEHFVYDKETEEIIYNKLFFPEFDTPPFMISSEDGGVYHLKEIKAPFYCIDKERTKWVSLDKIPEDKDMVLPRITADDLEEDGESFIMLNTLAEPLPKWKRGDAKYWEAETTFDTNDLMYYNGTYYLILKKYKSGYGFVFNPEYMRELSNSEVQLRLSKEYFPTLDLGYFKPGKNRVYLRNLNKAEQEGNFWYRKDFMFWEITCTPLYNDSIEMFGVPFYSTLRDSAEKDEDKRTFEIKVTPVDSTVSLIVNEIDIVTASDEIKEQYGYKFFNNTYQITVDLNTVINWSVSKEGYYTQSRIERIIRDEYHNISLIKKCTLTVNVIPANAEVVLEAHGYAQEGNTITVPEGTLISYKITKEGYFPKIGTVVIVDNETFNINLISR